MRENILIAFYCAEYNRVTNPATLKTDAQHYEDNETARVIRARLKKLNARVRESETGKLYPR
jgi:hypothetical protein